MDHSDVEKVLALRLSETRGSEALARVAYKPPASLTAENCEPYLPLVLGKKLTSRHANLTNAQPTQNDPHKLRRLRRPTGPQRAAMR